MISWSSTRFWLVIILLLTAAIYTGILRYARPTVKDNVHLANFPMVIEDWQAIENITIKKEVSAILNTDQYVWRKYAHSSGQEIWLLIAYFRDQKYGEQIHSPEHCVPGSGWRIIDREVITINNNFVNSQPIKANKLINANGENKELLYYWYQTRSGIIVNDFLLKFDLAKNALCRKPTDAAFVRINLSLKEDLQSTCDIASQFILTISSELSTILPFKN